MVEEMEAKEIMVEEMCMVEEMEAKEIMVEEMCMVEEMEAKGDHGGGDGGHSFGYRH